MGALSLCLVIVKIQLEANVSTLSPIFLAVTYLALFHIKTDCSVFFCFQIYKRTTTMNFINIFKLIITIKVAIAILIVSKIRDNALIR